MTQFSTTQRTLGSGRVAFSLLAAFICIAVTWVPAAAQEGQAKWLVLKPKSPLTTATLIEEVFRRHAKAALDVQDCSKESVSVHAARAAMVYSDSGCIRELGSIEDLERAGLRPLSFAAFATPVHLAVDVAVHVDQRPNAPIVFGVLETDPVPSESIAIILSKSLNRRFKVVRYPNHARLLDALRGKKIAFACVGEDGLGWTRSRMEQEGKNIRLTWIAWADLAAAFKIREPPRGGIALRSEGDARRTSSWAAPRIEGRMPRQASSSFFFDLPFFQVVEAREPELFVAFPVILARKDAATADFLRDLAASAVSIPLRVGATPCPGPTQELYKTYLLNAVAALQHSKSVVLDPATALSYWEQAHVAANADPHRSDELTAEAHWIATRLGFTEDIWTRARARQLQHRHDRVKCPITLRGWFSQGKRVASFSAAVEALRHAFGSPKDRQRRMEQACRCLSDAMSKEPQTGPSPSTCGTEERGLWTNSYLPYLVLSVLQHHEGTRGW